MASTGEDSECKKLVEVSEVLTFASRCIEAAGATAEHAQSLAEVILAADRRGHFSHGLNRVEMYVKELESGQCDGKATPVVVKETPGTAYVDGRNAIGPVVANFCMELAIKKAKTIGIGMVNCTGSNHFGIAGYYSLKAMKEGLIGIAFTNTSPVGVPTRAKKLALGTDPISFGAPASEGDSFLLDMASTTVAQGKLEVQIKKGESIPNGWLINTDGKESNDPMDMHRGAGLLYVGGMEESGGYKGYGLAMMVETLCGILGGGPYGPHIRKWNQKDSAVANLFEFGACDWNDIYWANDVMETHFPWVLIGAYLHTRPALFARFQADHDGQTFIALDPNAFAPDFTGRLKTFMQEMRGLEPADPDKPVLVAGDPERMHETKVAKDGGIWYHTSLITAVNEVAAKLKVNPIQTVK